MNLVYSLTPDISPFIYSAYSIPSEHTWGNKCLLSVEGVQHNDPLGPLLLLFCLRQASLTAVVQALHDVHGLSMFRGFQ